MIIGIGGISNAGKSKLAENIKDYFSDKTVKILCQDHFAHPTHTIPKINDHTNWEIPESLDFDKFVKNVIAESKKNDIVIDEGLFVFYDERLNRLYDKMIYLSISKKTFFERKNKDLRWGKEPGWYMEHIWESHQQFFDKIEFRKKAFQLSGENPVDFDAVVKYLES
jgi:uridine kinase